ncbi:hypothetical protein D3C71_1959790 [compost metagenome]
MTGHAAVVDHGEAEVALARGGQELALMGSEGIGEGAHGGLGLELNRHCCVFPTDGG